MTLPKQIPLPARIIAGTALIVLAVIAADQLIPPPAPPTLDQVIEERIAICDGIAPEFRKSCRDIGAGWWRKILR